MLEHKIAQLEERLRNARVIDTKRRRHERRLGRRPSCACATSTRRRRSSTTSSARPRPNPAERRLSNESPVGRAIIGHKKGETVEVQTPRGCRSSSRSWRSRPPDASLAAPAQPGVAAELRQALAPRRGASGASADVRHRTSMLQHHPSASPTGTRSPRCGDECEPLEAGRVGVDDAAGSPGGRWLAATWASSSSSTSSTAPAGSR